ncbi:hypothetical protein FRC17_002925 [Serendipita sp. 399]|nr:hypothetical protein FRC17_002925 [Serendipita sp. 399]
MQYSRGGSVGEPTPGMTGRSSGHQYQRSTSSSPEFAGGYDSTEYSDSPPDSSVLRQNGSAYATHGYEQTSPGVDAAYAGAPLVSNGSYHHQPTSYASGHPASGYATSPHETGYSGGHTYAYYDEKSSRQRDYPSPSAIRTYSGGPPASWGPSANYSGYVAPPISSRSQRHSNSPPLSPLDTRSSSYFPPTGRDYPLSAVTSSSAASGNVPSSPTTPSSVSDSPSTPFSPQHYSSPPYGHSHSLSASSNTSANAHIQGTPLPPLQLNTSTGGGHFVPPAGNEYPVPAASPYSPHGYGRSSPPEQTRLPPPAPQAINTGATQATTPGPYAGPGYAARPFLCDDCGMNFARTHDLKRHQTTHVAGVKKTHPCPYCGKNLSRRDAIKRHVVSKQCPVATEKGYGWPPPEGHVPPPPDTVIERTPHRRGENPYPVVGDRGNNYNAAPYSPSSPGAHYSPTTYAPPNAYNGTAPGAPMGYGGDHHGIAAPPATAVVYDYDGRSGSYKGR